MAGWRQCAECKKELPEELFREDSPECRTCARALRCRVAPGVVAMPKEAWARRVLHTIGAL
jgi:hypothetical protein